MIIKANTCSYGICTTEATTKWYEPATDTMAPVCDHHFEMNVAIQKAFQRGVEAGRQEVTKTIKDVLR